MGGKATVTFNADVGEGFGVYPMPAQVWRAEFMADGRLQAAEGIGATPIDTFLRHVSYVNLACGFHAGDPLLIKEYIALAHRCGCEIGAHVSFPDLAGFGNRYMEMEPKDLRAVIQYQIAALEGLAAMAGERIVHVKAHGALYNRAMADAALARTLVEAVAEYRDTLAIFGLPDSELQTAAHTAGLPFTREGFADRAYHSSGALVDRARNDSMVVEADAVAGRVLAMVRDGGVRSIEGKWVEIAPETISFHSDTPGSWRLLEAASKALREARIAVVGVGEDALQ